MPLKDSISVPRRGGISDLGDLNMPQGSFLYCMNGSIEAKSGEPDMYEVANDGSNILSVEFPAGYAVIGRVRISELNRTLYFLANAVLGTSEIGEVRDCVYDDDSDDLNGSTPCVDCDVPIKIVGDGLETIDQEPYCSYRTIISSVCLGFDLNFPVRVRYRVTDCSVNIYFTDNNSERRFAYFDYNADGSLKIQDKFKEVLGFQNDDCNQPIYGTNLDCNKILYHPHFNIPCIDFVDISEGGSLLAGTYQFIAVYSDAEGNPLSDFTPATQIVPIFTKQITFETNYPTDKSITIKINSLENTNLYSYYTVVVAETVDNFTTFKKLGVFPIGQTTIRYTGNDILQKIDGGEIFFKRQFYQKAGNVTNANDYLFFSDMSEYSIPNLQRVANNIKLYWQTAAIPEPAFKEAQNNFRFRSADRDEVYPYGVVFSMDNGQEFGPYHIPGLSKGYLFENYAVNVDEIIANEDVQQDTSCNNLTRNKRWQVYNTAFTVGAPHEIVGDCDFNRVWEWGEFSYWESIRTYPNEPEVWGDLCGKPIRHHKYPDSLISHFHDGLSGNKTFFDNNIVYPIGVRVNHSSVVQALNNAVTDNVITQTERDRITGYRIVRGNRVGNESNVAKGLLYDMWRYTRDSRQYYYANYPYNDLRPDNFIAPTNGTYSGSNTSNPQPITFTPTRRYTFHSPDVHFKNPTLGTEIKLETLEYGQSEGFFNHCDEQPKYRFLSTAATTLALAAGVAAAFSAEKEKECKVIISRNPTALVGTSPGAITTLPGIPGATAAVPLSLTDPTGVLKYNDFTGLATDPVTLTDPASLAVSEIHRNTCHGKTFQLLDPLSGNPAGLFLQQLIYLGIISMREMKIIEDLVLSMTPLKNFAIQYNSAGKYNNYLTIANSGNKVRSLDRTAYLEPTNQLINETINATTSTFSNININNWNRERSVYLKTDATKNAFFAPSVIDNSRITMNNAGLDQEDLLRKVYRTISSYYATIKRFIPDQYGSIGDIQYVETNGCNFDLTATYGVSETGVFGGDKFITRFALKRKMPFFLQTRFRQLQQADVEYSTLGNVGFPNYYFNVEVPIMQRIGEASFSLSAIFSGALLQDLLGVARSRLDARKNKFFYQSGFIHLYNYGIPYFLVESDVNTDYRHGENNLEKDFYPHQQDLEYWLQEKNVPITQDNYYFYNKTYSKQNKESFIGTQLPATDIRPCTVTHPNRVISSLPTSQNLQIDNWITFRPNDWKDFPLQSGKLVGLDGIESDKVLVRFENTSKVFNAYDVLKTDSRDIQVGTGGVFASRPKEFSSTTLGHAGAQHTDILLTEFGHIWVDSKRGQIPNLLPNASGMQFLGEGIQGWLQENLKFQIAKDFPAISLKNMDNNFKGVGLHLSFDKRFKRIFITKLDYKRLNKSIEYNATTNQFFFSGEPISLYDERYFCNKSFTISYNFVSKNWMYHPFLPNYYADTIDCVESGINFIGRGIVQSSLWSHNLTNKSYQVFYGVLYPFIIEIPSEAMIINNTLNSVQYDSTAIRYHNSYDYSFDRQVTFNKAWVYNERQHSGELNLDVRNENDLAASISYPKIEDGKQRILVTNFKNKWNFNQFWDTVNTQKGNIPFLLNTCSNAYKVLNLPALNYFKPDLEKQQIRGTTTRIRLIQDKISTHRLSIKYLKEDRTADE